MKKVAIGLIFCILLACLSACGTSNLSKEEKSGREYSVLEYRTTMQYHENFKILQFEIHNFTAFSQISISQSQQPENLLGCCRKILCRIILFHCLFRNGLQRAFVKH